MTVAGTHEIKTVWENELRPTLVHVPAVPMPVGGWPLVLAFHGRNIDAAAMVRMSGLSEAADRHGFVVAYLNGRQDQMGGRYWSVDYNPQAVVTGSDELPFVDSVLNELTTNYRVNGSRVVVTGFSNGAILAYAVALWRTERIFGVAGVAGLADFGSFELGRPLQLLHIHGTRDRFVPYEGGRTARKDVPIDFPPVPLMLSRWLVGMGCSDRTKEQRILDPNDENLSILIEEYGPGRFGSRAKMVTVENGGHTWPGRVPLVSYLGKWTTAIDGAELVAELVIGSV
jgi:polyhydroxybutyrate depolymerase